MTAAAEPGPTVVRAEVCTHPKHRRPVPAIARLYWPDGRYKPATACATDLPGQVRQSLDEGHPVEVWPVRADQISAHGAGGWRTAPDCGRCADRGRFRETGSDGITVDAHCTCKRGRRMSELWRAAKEGFRHPDEAEPEPPDDWDQEGAPF